MYLLPESVRELLNAINEFSGHGSAIIADSIYASVLRGDGIYPGEKELRDSTSMHNEKYAFGIEKTDAGKFFTDYGFSEIEIFDSKKT